MILHWHNLRFVTKRLLRGAFLITFSHLLHRSLILVLFGVIGPFAICNSFSQNSVRIAVYGGGSVDFVFNSLKDYNTGVTYNNWTLIGLQVFDDPLVAPGYTKWKLTVNIEDADADGFITGANAGNKLPFSTVEVKATVAAGCPSCHVYGSPYIALSAAPIMIVDGGPAVGPPLVPVLATAADQINISYRCGVTTSLLGSAADYYSDDIIYTLEMDP